MRLKRSFFDSDTNKVARELLGKKIVRVFNSGERIEAIITETEAYHGFEDKASHASRKKTERNKIMFEKGGLIYVYLVYGMHYCLNFTTMPEGFPAAVLVRSIALKNKNIEYRILNTKNKKNIQYSVFNIPINGPGRVCKVLEIDKSFYGEDLTKSKRIWIESVGANGCSPKIIAGKRIGVDYAGECKDWKWNYKIDLKDL